MKITGISVYQVDVPLTEPEDFALSKGRSYRTMDVNFVRIDTDEGITGWGEVLAWSSDYTVANPESARAGLNILAPHLIGMDPTQIKVVNHRMDTVLVENEFAKSPIDMACWDILGKQLGKPLYALLGGKLTERPPVYAFVRRSLEDEGIGSDLARHRANGISHFGTKASADVRGMMLYMERLREHLLPGESVSLDFNKGLRFDEALRIARAAAGVDVILEQPCETLEECRKVMEITGVPVMYDECCTTLRDVVKTLGDSNCSYLNVKIGRFGGITKTREVIDFCERFQIPVYIQDFGGTDITAAAVLHLAHNMSPRILGCMWDTHTMIGVTTATGLPPVVAGHMEATDAPGLGVEPVMDVMGAPIMVFE